MVSLFPSTFCRRAFVDLLSLAIVGLLVVDVDVVDGQQRRQQQQQQQGPQGRRRTAAGIAAAKEQDPFKGIFLIPLIFSFIILYPLGVFLYNFSRDPATPTLLANVKDMAVERTIGYLSSRSTGSSSSSRRGGRDATTRSYGNDDHED
jgi:hypothetical protein